METDPIRYEVKAMVSEFSLNELFINAWPDYEARTFGPVLAHSLTYICAFEGPRLIGFVNVAWDGGWHGFVLDTTVHRDYQRKGIGTAMMLLAAEESRKQGLAWLHADFAPHLEEFYRKCGYRHTEAGLLRV